MAHKLEDRMKRVGSVVLLALAVAMGTVTFTKAQEGKNQPKAKTSAEARWSGVIVRLNKDTSTVTVRKGHIEKVIHYDSSTKWTKGTGDVDQAQFSEGSRVICMGKYSEKKEFIASRIDLREPHMVPMP
jgi:hypothetical protein